MAVAWTRINTLLLLLVLFALLAVVAMLASGVRGGPLDPGTPPNPTDSVRLPGTPIDGQTSINAGGHYYLTRDIFVNGGQIAIGIAASNVSLDLGGFTIDGSDDAGSWGIWVAGVQTDITITNGVIRDFQFGIDAGDDSRVRIHHVSVVSNVRGMQVGDLSVVSDCAALSNNETGIYLPGSLSVVRNCVSRLNVADGVSLGGQNNVIEFSVVTNNAGAASIRSTGILNVVRDNVAGAIRIEANTNRVLNNTCVSGILTDVSGGPTHAANNFQC